MEPEKRKRVEEEFVIIDEQEEMQRAAKEKEQRALHTMTPRQRAELRSQMDVRVWQWLAVPVVCLVILLFLQGAASERYGASLALAWLVGVVISVVFGVISGINWTQINTDLRKGRVEYVEDSIVLDVQDSGRGGLSYTLSVGREKFAISREMFLSLSNHQAYRVYYARNSRIVLGAEPLF